MKFSGPRCGAGVPKRKRKPSSVRRSLEYPCVSRLRRRRLLALLSRHGFTSTFQALLQETTAFFSVDHLQRLARQGKWDDAIKYVVRFVPDADAMLGDEGGLFFSFIDVHKTIHSISIRKPHGAIMTEVYERDLRMYPSCRSNPGTVRLTRLLSALHRNHKLRAAIDWQLVRNRAADIIKDLIAKAPEFSDLLRLPECRDMPHDILPIRSRSSSRRRHHMKVGGGQHISAVDLTKFYLEKKRSGLQLSSSHCEGDSLVSGSPFKASILLADIAVESVKAGLCRVVQDEHPFEDTCKCNEAIRKRKRESWASCVVEVSGSGKHKRVRRSLEYPCVSRLRHRRLLAFLWHRRACFGSTFKAFVQESSVFFSVEHLWRLIFLGHWDDATNYISRFAPSVRMLGDVGKLFLSFLGVLKVLNCVAAGSPRGVLVAEKCERNLKEYLPNSAPGAMKLDIMLVTMLRCKQLRASLDWYRVRYKAANIAKDLITKIPEFNDLVRLPDCRDRPHHILPIGSCSHRRRHIKERGRIPASDIAGFYLQKKRSLPSSSQCEGNSLVPALPCNASLYTWLVDLVDESVKAGIHPEVCDKSQEHPSEDSCNEAR